MKKNLQTAFSTRQHMLSKDFEIYYYSDNHLYNIKSHVHDYYEFYFFLEGEVSIWIDKECYPVHTGDMILIPPGTPHFATVHNYEIPYRRFVFWIRQAYLKKLSITSADYVYLTQLADTAKHYIFHYETLAFHTLQAKVFQLIEEIHSEHFGKEVKISLCVNDLILYLNRTVYESLHPKTQREEQNLYQNLLQYIENHIKEELSLDRLAMEFYASKYHIAHVFKENLGISIHQFIIKKRLLMCRDAICSNTDIGEACLMYGFKDYSSFYRAFKKEFGLCPKEYQQIFGRNHIKS